MTEQKREIDYTVLYKGKVHIIKGFAEKFVSIDKKGRKNFYVRISDLQLCDGDGLLQLSPTEE